MRRGAARRQAFVSTPTDPATPRNGLMASVSRGRVGNEASVAVASGALLTCWRSILEQFSRLQDASRRTNRAVDILPQLRYLRTSVFAAAQSRTPMLAIRLALCTLAPARRELLSAISLHEDNRCSPHALIVHHPRPPSLSLIHI